MTGHETLTVRVLGPVQVLAPDGTTVDVPSASQRRLLAVLAVHAPGAVRSGWLCDVLELTPGALRTSVARLRRVVGDRLRTAAGGYRLDAAVDAAVACEQIDGAGDDPARLTAALGLWAGDALEEFRDEVWAVGEVRRLDEVRASAIEDLAELRLGAGEHDRAIQELEAHIVGHPHRDRPRGLLMRAMARAGRHTEALRAFQDYRTTLGETVGTEPTDELRAIEERIATGWNGVDTGPIPSGPDTSRRDDPLLDDSLTTHAAGVGRRVVLTRLLAAAERTQQDGAAVVVISGEGGIGKTTLVADFARSIAGECDVLYGRFDEQVGAPFHPLEAIIGRIADRLPDEQLLRHAARHGGDLLRLVPSLSDRIAAPTATPNDERTARQLLFEAATDVVARSARRSPIIIALDDLQWSGPAAALLLRHLTRNLGSLPVLLVTILRATPDDMADHVRELLADWAQERLDRIDLEGLDHHDLASLVQDRVPATVGHDVGPVVDALLDSTAGNPLFADHLLAHWDQSGRLLLEDHVVRVSQPVDFEVSATLRDLVWRRVSRLGDGAADMLTAGAVLGLEFDESVLAAMTTVEDQSRPELIDRAVAAGLLVDDTSAGRVRFTHALVAHALETDLRPRARRRLHARAYTAIMAVDGDHRRMAPRLAHHARAGGLPDEALQWAVEAGDAALTDLAPDEAARWYATAVEDAERLGRPDALRADLLVRLGEARAFAGDPTAIEVLTAGAELADRAGAEPIIVRAALAADHGTLMLGQPAQEQMALMERALEAGRDSDVSSRAILTASVAQRLIRADRAEDRTSLAEEALDLARAAGDPRVFGAVAARVLQALWAPGNALVRLTLAREATTAVRHVEDPDLVLLVFFTAYGAAVCAGEADDARAWSARVHEVAEEIRDPQLRWALGVLDGFEATMAARFDDAERIVAETVDLGVRIGAEEAIAVFAGQSFTLGTFTGRHTELLPFVEQGLETTDVELTFRLAHAVICCEIGRPEVAEDLLRAVMRGDVDRTPVDFLRSTELLALVVIALEVRDLHAAEWLLPQVAPLAGEVSFNSVTSHGPIAAYVGKLLSLLGRPADAETLLRTALATTERFGWTYHQATTLLALAQNRHQARGRLDDEGRGWLDGSEALCDRFGIAVWARRGAALRELVGS